MYILFLTFLINTLVFSTPNNIIKIINKERDRYHLDPVVYNYTLHDSLESFARNLTDEYWFYHDNPYKKEVIFHAGRNRTNRLEGTFLMDHKYFSDYPQFRHMFRDTVDPRKGISRIFQFRVNQRKCIDLDKCDKCTFQYYSTCDKYKVVQDKKKCSYVWAYYPKIIRRDLSEVACVLLRAVGRHTPPSLRHKQKGFFCYAVYSDSISDNPLE